MRLLSRGTRRAPALQMTSFTGATERARVVDLLALIEKKIPDMLRRRFWGREKIGLCIKPWFGNLGLGDTILNLWGFLFLFFVFV